MTEHQTDQDKQLDASLADFTDNVLDGNSDEMDMAVDNEQLQALQQTVWFMKQIHDDASQPDADMADRIKASLIAEWERSGLSRVSHNEAIERPSIWQSLLNTIFPVTTSGRRSLSTAMAGATFLILILFIAFSLVNSGAITASSGTQGGGSDSTLVTFIIVVGAVLGGGVVLWLLARDK